MKILKIWVFKAFSQITKWNMEKIGKNWKHLKEPISFDQNRFSWNRWLLLFSSSEAIIHKSEILRHGCSPVNLLHLFRTPFPKNTLRRLLLASVSSQVFDFPSNCIHICRNIWTKILVLARYFSVFVLYCIGCE